MINIKEIEQKIREEARFIAAWDKIQEIENDCSPSISKALAQVKNHLGMTPYGERPVFEFLRERINSEVNRITND